MNIDPKHHKFLIGPGGNRIKEVIAKAGGPEDKSSQAGIVKFPRLDDGGSRINEVVIKGSEELVKKIKEEGLNHSKVMEYLSYMTDVYGPRLTASPQMKAAQAWAKKTFTEIGLQNANIEPWGSFGRGWRCFEAGMRSCGIGS